MGYFKKKNVIQKIVVVSTGSRGTELPPPF